MPAKLGWVVLIAAHPLHALESSILTTRRRVHEGHDDDDHHHDVVALDVVALGKTFGGRIEHLGKGFCRDKFQRMPWNHVKSCTESVEECIKPAIVDENVACVTVFSSDTNCAKQLNKASAARCETYTGTATAVTTRADMSLLTGTFGESFAMRHGDQTDKPSPTCSANYGDCSETTCCMHEGFGCFQKAAHPKYAQCRPLEELETSTTASSKQFTCKDSNEWTCPGWELCAGDFQGCFQERCCRDGSFGCSRRPDMKYAQCRPKPRATEKPCADSDEWLCPGWQDCAASLESCSLSHCCKDPSHQCLKQVGGTDGADLFCRPIDVGHSTVAHLSSRLEYAIEDVDWSCVNSDKWLCPSTWKARVVGIVTRAEAKIAEEIEEAAQEKEHVSEVIDGMIDPLTLVGVVLLLACSLACGIPIMIAKRKQMDTRLSSLEKKESKMSSLKERAMLKSARGYLVRNYALQRAWGKMHDPKVVPEAGPKTDTDDSDEEPSTGRSVAEGDSSCDPPKISPRSFEQQRVLATPRGPPPARTQPDAGSSVTLKESPAENSSRPFQVTVGDDDSSATQASRRLSCTRENETAVSQTPRAEELLMSPRSLLLRSSRV